MTRSSRARSCCRRRSSGPPTPTSTPGPSFGKPLVALVPEFDDYLRPAEAAERFKRVPQAEVVGVEGAKHLWVGEPYVRIVLDHIAGRLNPSAAPLPTTIPT